MRTLLNSQKDPDSLCCSSRLPHHTMHILTCCAGSSTGELVATPTRLHTPQHQPRANDMSISCFRATTREEYFEQLSSDVQDTYHMRNEVAAWTAAGEAFLRLTPLPLNDTYLRRCLWKVVTNLHLRHQRPLFVIEALLPQELMHVDTHLPITTQARSR
jgi:hypothetical protein